MSKICVSPYEAQVGVGHEDTPLCIASWAHTEDQVLYAVYGFAGLLFLSIVWTLLSRLQKKSLRRDEIGFSLTYRRWAQTSRAAAIISRPLQLAVSCCIFGITAARCSTYTVDTIRYHFVTFFYALSLLDDGVRFLGSRYKILYCFDPLTLVEILSIASHLEVAYGPTHVVNGVESRTWLDFSVMRPIFIFRAFVEMESRVARSSKGWMMARLAMRIILLIMAGATIIFFVETLGEMPYFEDNGFAHLYACDNGTVTKQSGNDCSDETWSVSFAFYFIIVTLSTVGYGDNSPSTVISRLLIIVFIVMGIILFSMEVETLVGLYNLRQVGNPPYKVKPERSHVVLMGNPSFSQLLSILRELFHEDHVHDAGGADRFHAVVLGERKSKFTDGLIDRIQTDPVFAARVTYVAGSATNSDDLDRAHVRDADAVMVFPDKLAEDAESEDARNIMRVLATRRHCGPKMRVLVMVLRAENARHMLAGGVDRDDIICDNVMKMGALAQSAVAPGTSTMLANLASSLSVGTNDVGHAKKGKLLSLKSKEHAMSIERPTVASSTASNARDWKNEYYAGASKEMYLIQLSSKYAGVTFAQASARILKDTNGGVVLVAVEVLLPDGEPRVLLNPGQSLVVSEWMQCYVVADDIEHVLQHGVCVSDHQQVFSDDMVQPKVDASSPQSMQDEDEREVTTKYAAMTSPSVGNRSPALRSQSTTQARDRAKGSAIANSLQTIAQNLAPTHAEIPYDSVMHSMMQGRSRGVSVNIPSCQNREPSLDPPPLEVLLNKDHIVVCSFLGDEALSSLQWLLLPLRGAYAEKHPPVTILDATEPSTNLINTLGVYKDVFYVKGSPLIYSDLQRAGAKAANAVVVLGRRASGRKSEEMGEAWSKLQSSIGDSEAVFATMLVELKMDFTRIFTITELADEANSRFLGMSFQLKSLHVQQVQDNLGGVDVGYAAMELDTLRPRSFWDQMLSNNQSSEGADQAIYGLPLYMSGRLLHPEFCESLLIQTFYNPSIHKIMRQLVGGPRCTGVFHSFNVPTHLKGGCTYGDVFDAFALSRYSGVCIGVYRISTQVLGGGHAVKLPIIITAPTRDFYITDDDKLFVLIGVHTIQRAARRIQGMYWKMKKGRGKATAGATSSGPSKVKSFIKSATLM